MKRLMIWLLTLALALAAFGGSALGNPEDERLRGAFRTAAFRAEYDSIGTDLLRRWESPLLIFAEGDATTEDIAGLKEFVGQLNERVAGLPAVRLTESPREANIKITFAPLDRFEELEENYVPVNWGFFYFWYNSAYVIDAARILIAADVTTQAERDHLIREELVGVIGLPNDLADEPDSILFQAWTTTRELSALDWQLLNLVYDGRLTSGMGWSEAQMALGW